MAATRFRHAFTCGAPSLDVMLSALGLTIKVIYYHIFSCESVAKAVQRISQDFLFHARAIYVSNGQAIEKYTLAPLRREPNGLPVLSPCCKEPAIYRKKLGHALIYRCINAGHPKDVHRGFEVPLIVENRASHKTVGGYSHRIMISYM